MRLLMVAEATTPHTEKWAHYFRDQGNDVLVVSTSNSGSNKGARIAQFPPPGAWWERLPRERFGGGVQRWLAGWPEWRRLVTAFDPHIVHVHYVFAEARNYFYYRGVRHLIVSTYGSDVVFEPDDPPSRKTTRRIRSLLNQADSVTATTEFLAAETRRFLPSAKDIHVIPFGVDCDKFRPRSAESPHLSQPLTLGFVKHFEPKYGPAFLLEAFALIHERHPRTRLVMAGKGSLEAQLKEQTRRLGLMNDVAFVGQVPHEDVPTLMQDFDIFVMPSVYQSETFGVAAIEASACELPVVATSVGGVSEAVVDGQTGILVPPKDPKALAHACIHLIEQPDRRLTLGKAGRIFVLDRFRMEDVGAKMNALYHSILRQ